MIVTFYMHDAIPNELEGLYESCPGLREHLEDDAAEHKLYYSLHEVELDCDIGSDGSVRLVECRWRGQTLRVPEGK